MVAEFVLLPLLVYDQLEFGLWYQFELGSGTHDVEAPWVQFVVFEVLFANKTV